MIKGGPNGPHRAGWHMLLLTGEHCLAKMSQMGFNLKHLLSMMGPTMEGRLHPCKLLSIPAFGFCQALVYIVE